MSATDTPSSPGVRTYLAGLNAEMKRRLLLAVIAAGLIVYAYFIYKSCWFQTVPVSLFGWLWVFWSRGAEYAHGYVVPVVAIGVFAWKWRQNLHALPLRTSSVGLVIVVAAMLLYVAGVRAAVPRIVAGSFPVLLFGLILYLGGWAWARELWFPCAFLLFMIPLNFLDPYVSFPLRLFVAEAATHLLNLVGLSVYRQGTGIYSQLGRFAPLDVADPCSGVRSLVALMALTALYGYITMDKAWKKWLLFLSSALLAVIGNLARITTVALVAQGFGEDWAMRIYHDYSGYIVFSLAIICMIALGTALNVHYRELIHRWLYEEVPLPAPPPRPPRPRNHR
jgi:exosortase